jgi:hypothetical protein
VLRATCNLLLLALVLTSSRRLPLGADEPVVTFDLSQARVRASPGWPAALEGFLPPGRPVEPLTRDGENHAQLILGLWDSDPVARDIGTHALGLDPRLGPRGGYVAALGLNKGHPVALLIAQDAAALAAARFELETFSPDDVAMTERRVDVMQPDAEGGVRMAFGRRDVVPPFRIRALGGLTGEEGPLDVAAAHGNRLWIDEREPQKRGPRRSHSLLAEHGVFPVAQAALWLAPSDHARLLAGYEPPSQGIERLLAWQKEGVRHFAVTLRAPDGMPLDAGLARHEQALVEDVARALRPGGLAELLVVPLAASDDAERRLPAPDLRAIPEALLAWKGPTEKPASIPFEVARRKAARAGVPVVLLETWMEGVRGMPSAPRGRDPQLGEVLAGIVVLGGSGAAEVLSRAWSPVEASDPQRDAASLFASVPAFDAASDLAAWCAEVATSIEAARAGRIGDPHWLQRLPARARDAAEGLPPPGARLLVRSTTEPVTTDGRLAERAWRDAPALALGPAVARGLAERERVVVGVEVPASLRADALLEVTTLGGPGLPRTRRMKLAPRGCPGAPIPTAFEVALDHYDLGGDPHPALRCAFNLRLVTSRGAWTMAAPAGPPQIPVPGGALLVVR